MKGLSAIAFFSSMLGFGSQWTISPKLEDESNGVEEQQVQKNQVQKIGPMQNLILVNEEQRLISILPTIVSEEMQKEIGLYPEFSPLQAGDQIEIWYAEQAAPNANTLEAKSISEVVAETILENVINITDVEDERTPLRLLIRRSKYEQLRIELTPEPSIVVDIFPLEPKSLVFTFTKEDLFKPTQELLDILDAEPGLLAVMDNQVDLIKGLEAEDNIEILAVGRYRGEKLQKLESVLSVRINQQEESTLLFKYGSEEEELWFTEDLSPCSFPFLQTPTDHILISSWFGEKRGTKVHKAIDFAANIGQPIYATADGVISKAGWGTGYGMMTIIDHEELGDYESLYAHMSRSYVKEGQHVRQGQLIGLVGSTGHSTGPHLHYEIRENNHKVNPRSKVLVKKFLPENIDDVTLAAFRDQVDQIFVEATSRVVDVSSLLTLNTI